jgi:hypothetical protein
MSTYPVLIMFVYECEGGEELVSRLLAGPHGLLQAGSHIKHFINFIMVY